MRFLYLDRLLEVAPGSHVRAVKTFPLSEAYLQGHYSRWPVVPGSILIEAMAQICGWLVIRTLNFRMSCVISLIDDVIVPSDLRPGTTVEIVGEIVNTNARGTLCRARVESGGEVIASAGRFLFPHFENKDPEGLRRKFHAYGWIENEPGVEVGG